MYAESITDQIQSMAGRSFHTKPTMAANAFARFRAARGLMLLVTLCVISCMGVRADELTQVSLGKIHVRAHELAHITIHTLSIDAVPGVAWGASGWVRRPASLPPSLQTC